METIRRRTASRPVRATDASTVSVSSGFTDAQIDHFDLESFGAELLRDSERFVHHRAVAHDAEIASGPSDPRFADRQFLPVGRCVGLEMVIKILVFAVDDRVIDGDRVNQHRVSVFHRRRRHDNEPGIMRVKSIPLIDCGTDRCLSFRLTADEP